MSAGPAPNLLLTGPPGVGKTTALRRVFERLPRAAAGGFFTEELRAGGGRVGFRLVDPAGRTALLAHRDLDSDARVGRYGVDVPAFEAFVAEALSGEADVWLVDEVGKMECFSPAFVARVEALLAAPAPVVATIALRGGGPIAALKRRPDVERWALARADRDAAPERVLAWLRARGVAVD